MPVTKREFAAAVSPILALVAPSGMSEDDRKGWLAAAYKALDGIPIGLLERGVAEAMRRADHPAKVVPAIIAAVDADWQWRRNYRPREEPIKLLATDPVREKQEADERAEVAKLMSGLVKKWSAKHDA